MVKGRFKLLTLLYSILFLVLSYFFVKSDFDNHYSILYVLFELFLYIMLNTGLILYALRKQTSLIRAAWKYSFPLMVIILITSVIVDSNYGQNRNADIGGWIGDIIVFIILLLIFYPAFRASFILGYYSIKADN